VHLLRGVIDLAWRDGSGWHIADWKTDADTSGDGLNSRHADQVATYVRIWTYVTGRPREGLIVSVGRAQV
jgi:ATP-dependent exoDNAse (exonuclease V) beta subunit